MSYTLYVFHSITKLAAELLMDYIVSHILISMFCACVGGQVRVCKKVCNNRSLILFTEMINE